MAQTSTATSTAGTAGTPRTRDLVRALRFALLQLQQSQAPTMAANLAFRTLFGMLPVLVVATIVTSAVLGDAFSDLVHNVVLALGLDTITVAPAQGSVVQGSPTAGVPLGAWIENMASDAANVDLPAIGAVGALIVVFSAVWTVAAIEASFNTICRAPSGRPFVRRVLIYWFVITAGPVLFAAIPLAFRSINEFVGHDTAATHFVLNAISTVGGFVSLWVLLFAAYAMVPNARVNLRAAMLGAFVATLLIEIGKRFLGASLTGSFAASRLYGSLGLVPLFMLWVYLMWLVVLFGLQTAAILEGLAGRGRILAAPANAPDIFEPATSLACFRAVCARFRHGRGASVETLVRECGVAPACARDLLAILERRQLVHRADSNRRDYMPSRPPETIAQADVLRAAFALADGGEECHAYDEIAELREAQLAKLGDATF